MKGIEIVINDQNLDVAHDRQGKPGSEEHMLAWLRCQLERATRELGELPRHLQAIRVVLRVGLRNGRLSHSRNGHSDGRRLCRGRQRDALMGHTADGCGQCIQKSLPQSRRRDSSRGKMVWHIALHADAQHADHGIHRLQNRANGLSNVGSLAWEGALEPV